MRLKPSQPTEVCSSQKRGRDLILKVDGLLSQDVKNLSSGRGENSPIPSDRPYFTASSPDRNTSWFWSSVQRSEGRFTCALTITSILSSSKTKLLATFCNLLEVANWGLLVLRCNMNVAVLAVFRFLAPK